jgi:hypothetical protein
MKSERELPDVEYREGCPLCDHSDPELDVELEMFAELLLDIYADKRGKG